MSCPSVSVVIATYNYGHYLAEALESIRAQTFTDWEAIVVDDGSTDDTPNVMQPFLSDSRIRYHKRENRGPSAARNLGISQSSGPLVAFLDADDRWLPAKLERQVELFRRDSELGLAFCRRQVIDASGRRLKNRGAPAAFHRGNVLSELFCHNFVSLSTTIVRRSVLDQVGVFDESYCRAEDYDLWLRVAARYRFDYVDEVLIEQRIGHVRLSIAHEAMSQSVVRIMKRFLNDYGGRASLSPSLARLAFSEAYCQLAFNQRGRSRSAALVNFLRALWQTPLSAGPWRGLAGLPVPEFGRQLFRRARGRPDDRRASPPGIEEERVPIDGPLPDDRLAANAAVERQDASSTRCPG